MVCPIGFDRIAGLIFIFNADDNNVISRVDSYQCKCVLARGKASEGSSLVGEENGTPATGGLT
jgi:hypothetical protein